jgi:co-chaperonin GroES (HSP10)
MKELDLKKIPSPAGHRVIVKTDKVEEKSAGGVILSVGNTDRKQDAQVAGVLVAIGPNAWKAFDGGEPWASVGDRVMHACYAGYSIKINGDMYRIMNDEDITAVISE